MITIQFSLVQKGFARMHACAHACACACMSACARASLRARVHVQYFTTGACMREYIKTATLCRIIFLRFQKSQARKSSLENLAYQYFRCGLRISAKGSVRPSIGPLFCPFITRFFIQADMHVCVSNHDQKTLQLPK